VTAPEFPRRVFPCDECPWRVTAEPGRFPACRYEDLAATAGDAGIYSPMFGCHKGAPGTDEDLGCAGWLAIAGREHAGVRLAVAMGRLPIEALLPGGNWPELYGSYAEMAAANGAGTEPDDQPGDDDDS
jgi:hypothetical protein